MSLAKPSVQSLVITMKRDHAVLGSATGFIVETNGTNYLVTNWHVVTGRRYDSGQPMHPSGALPNKLLLTYFMPQTSPHSLGWEEREELIYGSTENPLWLEHPTFGRAVDVVALPLTNTVGAEIYPYSLAGQTPDVLHQVADMVNIVGFPFGLTAGGRLAVWTKGGTASEPDVDFNEKPCFLIDARTRKGQSGSPVIIYSNGGSLPLADGGLGMFSGPVVRLLGVYSGRMSEESDLGIVWKTRVVEEILMGSKTGNGDLAAP